MLVRMICPECGQAIKLVCRDCQRKRAHRGLLLHQRRFLITWLAGAIELRVRPQGDRLHLELFDDRWHAYCGADMFTVTPRQLVREVPAGLCEDCLKVFDQLVAQYAAAEGIHAR